MRLIDADSIPWDVEGVGEIPVITKEEIDQLPTVNIPTVGESVGVIRCKDCTWCFAPKNKGWADDVLLCSEGLETRLVGENDFCSKGERKEE